MKTIFHLFALVTLFMGFVSESNVQFAITDSNKTPARTYMLHLPAFSEVIFHCSKAARRPMANLNISLEKDSSLLSCQLTFTMSGNKVCELAK